MGRHEPYRTSADRGGSLRAPERIPGAEWQAGVTPDNAAKKVLLNGEPAPLAFAASAAGGWAMCHPEPTLSRTPTTTRAPLGLAYLIDQFADKVLRRGRVQIVAADLE
jgi:hypothetical protein